MVSYSTAWTSNPEFDNLLVESYFKAKRRFGYLDPTAKQVMHMRLFEPYPEISIEKVRNRMSSKAFKEKLAFEQNLRERRRLLGEQSRKWKNANYVETHLSDEEHENADISAILSADSTNGQSSLGTAHDAQSEEDMASRKEHAADLKQQEKPDEWTPEREHPFYHWEIITDRHNPQIELDIVMFPRIGQTEVRMDTSTRDRLLVKYTMRLTVESLNLIDEHLSQRYPPSLVFDTKSRCYFIPLTKPEHPHAMRHYSLPNGTDVVAFDCHADSIGGAQ